MASDYYILYSIFWIVLTSTGAVDLDRGLTQGGSGDVDAGAHRHRRMEGLRRM